MIGWFAAHKAVVLIGGALIAAAVLLLRHRGGGASSTYGGIPTNPYATNSPPGGDGGLSLQVAGAPRLPSPAPLQDPEPGGPAPGPAAEQGASVDVGGAGAQVSTGPGAGPAIAAPVFAQFVPDAVAPAFGTVGDLPAFQPVEPSYNPIYGGTTTVGDVPVALVGTSGTVSDIRYAPGGQALSVGTGGGVPALVDPSGHVVNAKGARVGGFAGD